VKDLKGNCISGDVRERRIIKAIGLADVAPLTGSGIMAEATDEILHEPVWGNERATPLRRDMEKVLLDFDCRVRSMQQRRFYFGSPENAFVRQCICFTAKVSQVSDFRGVSKIVSAMCTTRISSNLRDRNARF